MFSVFPSNPNSDSSNNILPDGYTENKRTENVMNMICIGTLSQHSKYFVSILTLLLLICVIFYLLYIIFVIYYVIICYTSRKICTHHLATSLTLNHLLLNVSVQASYQSYMFRVYFTGSGIQRLS